MYLKTVSIGLLIVFGLTACVPIAVTEQPPTLAPFSPTLPAAATVPAPVPTPTLPVLTPEVLKNMAYDLPVSQKTVKLVDGKYQAASGEAPLSVGMAEPIAFGDLNGDNNDEAAVVLGENTGGTGTFQSLIVVTSQAGAPVQVAAFHLGDRVRIEAITIQDQRVTIDMIVHGPQDPLCCPTVPVSETFRLTRTGLRIDRVTSKTPGGQERIIQIESPAEGTQVDSQVEVKGSVTIAPFENNLVYRTFTEENDPVAEGHILVNASEPGGQGTFETTIDLSAIPSGQYFWLEIGDLSAADGSTLALSTVRLLRK